MCPVQRRGEVNREALLELGDRLRDCTSTSEITYAAGEVLGRTLDVDRVGYGEVEPTADTALLSVTGQHLTLRRSRASSASVTTDHTSKI